jgi:hypothetical protein
LACPALAIKIPSDLFESSAATTLFRGTELGLGHADYKTGLQIITISSGWIKLADTG